MSAVLNTLCQRLAHVRDTGAKGRPLWGQWLDEPLPISPWQTWTLFGLVRHHSRQQFVADIIKYRLNADQVAIAAAGALGHPEIPQKGIVPGLADWEYYFHGCGCCLTHRVGGESIDVDFYDSTADWFDDFFYVNYLRSLKQPAFVEARLTSLHRSYRTVTLSMVDLIKLGLVEKLDDRKVVRLAFDDEPLSELLRHIESRWADESVQVALAFAVGDWLLADQLDTAEHAAKVQEKAATCRDQRTVFLINQFRSGIDQADVLCALQDLECPLLPDVVRDALRGKPSGTTSAALAVIDEWNDATGAMKCRS